MPGAADIMHHVMYMYITQVKNVKRNAKSMDEYHIASVKKTPANQDNMDKDNTFWISRYL